MSPIKSNYVASNGKANYTDRSTVAATKLLSIFVSSEVSRGRCRCSRSEPIILHSVKIYQNSIIKDNVIGWINVARSVRNAHTSLNGSLKGEYVGDNIKFDLIRIKCEGLKQIKIH
jgi:hypothetical protein